MRAAAIGLVVILVLAFVLYDSGERDDPPRSGAAARHGSLAAAVDDVLSGEDQLTRAAELATALQGFGPEALADVEEAWATIEEDTGGSKTLELTLLVGWWCRYEPEGAFSWLNGKYRHLNPVMMTTLVRCWATRSPIAASRAVTSLPKVRQTQDTPQLINAVVIGWNASGESGVEEFLMALSSDVNRQIALTALANAKVRRDGVEEAIRWAQALPDSASGDFKQQAHRRVATAIAGVDPIRAAGWAETLLAGEWGTGVPRRVAQRWSQEDGQAAMEWLRSLPTSPDLPKAFEDTYRRWLSNDREAALEWLPDQKRDASLDPAVSLYAQSVARDDPEAALPWAAQVQDATRRDETLEQIARIWMRRDGDTARAWIETSDLSDNARQRVYAAAEKNRARKQPGRRAPRAAESLAK